MKIEYMGYTIEVTTSVKFKLWIAVVLINPIIISSDALHAEIGVSVFTT